jgi:hypothetical protein
MTLPLGILSFSESKCLGPNEESVRLNVFLYGQDVVTGERILKECMQVEAVMSIENEKY